MMMKQLLYFCLLISLLSCKTSYESSQKINGISFVASKDSISAVHVIPITKLNANYVALMPFGFLKNLNSPDVHYNSKKQWYGETKEGTKQYMDVIQQEGIKVMMKPQIWVWRGDYTGHIEMNSEEDWTVLEGLYSDFILEYAQLAQDHNVDIFCVGTELEQFINQRPEYWTKLISDVKTIYKGKLTYAANWDEYKHTPFWEELDLIGINAYFPLSFNKTPSIEDCRQGWEKHKIIIKEIAEKNKKNVLFTEYGYRSVNFTAKEPWISDRNNAEVNLKGQAQALQALYDEFWNEDWFAGGFLWKWYHDHEKKGDKNNTMFTPQNKPAECIVRELYINN